MAAYQSPGMKFMASNRPPNFTAIITSTAGRTPPLHKAPLPTAPGRYWWTEWGEFVEVYKRGRKLYVKPSPGNANTVEVVISEYIAGDFYKHKKDAPK